MNIYIYRKDTVMYHINYRNVYNREGALAKRIECKHFLEFPKTNVDRKNVNVSNFDHSSFDAGFDQTWL